MTTSTLSPSNLVAPMDVRDEVRVRYAERARAMTDVIELTASPSATAACCSPANETESCGCGNGYAANDLALLPAAVAETSLGCGDPITIAQLQPGQRVLDLGSGGGLDCLLAAKKVDDSGWVIGVDMTPDMLSLAWRNAAKVGIRNVEFRFGHIEQLPVESDSIDVILSNCVINLSPDKPAVFCEAYRVLRVGGKFAVSDIVSDGEIPSEARADLDSYTGCVSGAAVEADYLAALQDAGFRKVKVVDRRHYATVPGSDVQTYSIRVEAVK